MERLLFLFVCWCRNCQSFCEFHILIRFLLYLNKIKEINDFFQDFDEDYYCDKFHTGDKCQFMQDCKHDSDCKNGEFLWTWLYAATCECLHLFVILWSKIEVLWVKKRCHKSVLGFLTRKPQWGISNEILCILFY